LPSGAITLMCVPPVEKPCSEDRFRVEEAERREKRRAAS
jgi:hypothetical protein